MDCSNQTHDIDIKLKLSEFFPFQTEIVVVTGKFLLSISSVNISNGIGSTQFPVLNFFSVKAKRQTS